MCGIAGVFNFDGSPVSAERLERMSLAMKYRGPDDHGAFIAPGIGIAHRRLSVIDLSAAAKCPMANDDDSIQVVFNGEIYNYQVLRKELQALGHQFKSASDTEVIVRGYEQWGVNAVDRFEGMFAFAVWDANHQRLFLARDRVGEKPLYYVKNEKRLVFASSLIALREYFGADMAIDFAAVDCFFSHTFIPSPTTIWKSVEAFPPAHRVACDKTGNFRVERYWDFPDSPPKKVSINEAEALIETELEHSVKARLVADVPVGGFLSGGVDSSLVMALAAKNKSQIDTFSIGFKEAEYSELEYARQAATAIGSRHHELMVDEKDLLDVLPELIWQLGQPFADSSVIPTHMVSRFARKSVTVSLSGDGGDESFAGYWRYSAAWYAEKYAQLIPHSLRQNTVPSLLRKFENSRFEGIAGRINAMNRLSLSPSGTGFTNAQSWFNYRSEIFGDSHQSYVASHDPAVYRTGKSWGGQAISTLRQMTYDDFQVLLPDDYLNKVDVASMAASLEVRTPMLDRSFIEAAWLLPDNYKLRYGQPKWLLKRIAEKYIPSSVIYRKKMGFALPMEHWWRSRLAKVLKILMQDSRGVSYGWIKSAPVLRALQEHLDGRSNHDMRLWQILCFELWLRIVVEGSLSKDISLSDVLR